MEETPLVNIFVVATLLSFLAVEQSSNGETSSAEVILSSAKRAISDRRGEFTLNSHHGRVWFDGISGTVNASNPVLEIVTRGIVGRQLSLQDSARPGDVVKVTWMQKDGRAYSVLLVYTGEERFPDGAGGNQSFFIYPYRTRLEHSTIPPRKNYEYFYVYRDKWQLTLSLFYEFSEPDNLHADTEWMEDGFWNRGAVVSQSFLAGDAKYVVYRVKPPAPSSSPPTIKLDKSKLLRQVTRHEGKRKKVYNDTEGIPTIGVGFNLRRADAKLKIEALGLNYAKVLGGHRTLTDMQISALLEADIDQAIKDCKSIFPDMQSLSDVRQRVLIDMLFNLGKTRFLRFAKTINAVKSKKFTEAADEMKNSRWYRQVGTRAKTLTKMMRKNVDFDEQ